MPGGEGTIAQVAAGISPQEIKGGELSGLSASHTYYVRLFAENVDGHETSAAVSFETGGKPMVETFATHTLDGETVRVLGSVRPHGADTHVWVQYVSEEQFAASGFAEAAVSPEVDEGAGADEGSGFRTKLIGIDLLGLRSGKSYRYRLLASNEAGTVIGAEQTLSVPSVGSGEEASCPNEALRTGPSAALPDCRAYEQVTPVDKGGTEDIFSYGTTENTLVGEDGDHFMVHAPGTQWGSEPDSSASNYFFRRSANGWQMTSATPQPQAARTAIVRRSTVPT